MLSIHRVVIYFPTGYNLLLPSGHWDSNHQMATRDSGRSRIGSNPTSTKNMVGEVFLYDKFVGGE